MSDTLQGETAQTEALKNEANTTTTPQVNVADPAEVERLRKLAEQAQMRAQQLENENKKLKEKEEADRLKQLEEQNEWKSVAEQNKAKLEALQAEREAEERAKQLQQETDAILKQYPPAVQELAKEVGLGLGDVTDESKASLAEKLEVMKAKVGASDKVSPNNPSNPTPPTAGREELIVRMAHGDKNARTQVISELPGVKEMRKMAGFSE